MLLEELCVFFEIVVKLLRSIRNYHFFFFFFFFNEMTTDIFGRHLEKTGNNWETRIIHDTKRRLDGTYTKIYRQRLYGSVSNQNIGNVKSYLNRLLKHSYLPIEPCLSDRSDTIEDNFSKFFLSVFVPIVPF